MERSKKNRTAIIRRSTDDDPLVARRSPAYPGSAMRRPSLSHRAFLVVCLAVVVTTAGGAFLAVREYDALLFDAFRERSIAYVQAFIASTRPWLDPVHPDMLRAASRMLLVGSTLYVELLVGGEVVVQERVDGSIPLARDDGDPFPGVRAEKRILSEDGEWVLEVTVPIVALSSETGEGSGRAGIDPTALRVQTRNTALLAAAATLLFDITVLGAVFWGMRPSRSSITAEFSAALRAPRVAGPLVVDADQKTITLSGHPVALTPKQFSLLAFLAENVDRVCSDREILEAVWADSPYADSKDVKQYVYLVRRRLATIDSNERNRIQTVPGFGYKLISGAIDSALTDE